MAYSVEDSPRFSSENKPYEHLISDRKLGWYAKHLQQEVRQIHPSARFYIEDEMKARLQLNQEHTPSPDQIPDLIERKIEVLEALKTAIWTGEIEQISDIAENLYQPGVYRNQAGDQASNTDFEHTDLVNRLSEITQHQPQDISTYLNHVNLPKELEHILFECLDYDSSILEDPANDMSVLVENLKNLITTDSSLNLISQVTHYLNSTQWISVKRLNEMAVMTDEDGFVEEQLIDNGTEVVVFGDQKTPLYLYFIEPEIIDNYGDDSELATQVSIDNLELKEVFVPMGEIGKESILIGIPPKELEKGKNDSCQIYSFSKHRTKLDNAGLKIKGYIVNYAGDWSPPTVSWGEDFGEDEVWYHYQVDNGGIDLVRLGYVEKDSGEEGFLIQGGMIHGSSDCVNAWQRPVDIFSQVSVDYWKSLPLEKRHELLVQLAWDRPVKDKAVIHGQLANVLDMEKDILMSIDGKIVKFKLVSNRREWQVRFPGTEQTIPWKNLARMVKVTNFNDESYLVLDFFDENEEFVTSSLPLPEADIEDDDSDIDEEDLDPEEIPYFQIKFPLSNGQIIPQMAREGELIDDFDMNSSLGKTEQAIDFNLPSIFVGKDKQTKEKFLVFKKPYENNFLVVKLV